MKYRIHFEYPDGTPDSFVVEGDDVATLSEDARKGVDERNGKNPWSEEID